MVIGQVHLKLKVDNIEDFGVVFKTMYSPRSIKRIENKLPVGGPATKLDHGLVLVMEDISIPPEYQKMEFTKGEISVDPSNASITIYLEDTKTETPLNLLGLISENHENLGNITSSAHIVFEKIDIK